MSKTKLFIHSILQSAGVVVYVAAVAWILTHFNDFFGESPNIGGATALLLLLVISATIVGSLVLARPAYLYVNGLRKEAIKLLSYTVGFLIIILLLVLMLISRG